MGREPSAEQERTINLTERGRRVVDGLKIAGLGMLATGGVIAVVLFPGGESTSKSDEQAAEACVAELVGHEVNLERYTDGEHDGLMIAESVEDEQRACMRNGYDASEARIDLGR
jgi:hypothetical protein